MLSNLTNVLFHGSQVYLFQSHLCLELDRYSDYIRNSGSNPSLDFKLNIKYHLRYNENKLIQKILNKTLLPICEGVTCATYCIVLENDQHLNQQLNFDTMYIVLLCAFKNEKMSKTPDLPNL